MSDGSLASGQPSLAARIDTEKSHQLAWKTVVKRAAVVAIAGISLYLVFPVLAYDAPLRWTGRTVQRLRNWVLRKRPPMTGLDESLMAQRNEIRAVLGRQWWQALVLSAGRLAFDYLCSPGRSRTAYSSSGIEAAGPHRESARCRK